MGQFAFERELAAFERGDEAGVGDDIAQTHDVAYGVAVDIGPPAIAQNHRGGGETGDGGAETKFMAALSGRKGVAKERGVRARAGSGCFPTVPPPARVAHRV
jgi:hypothetical protein